MGKEELKELNLVINKNISNNIKKLLEISGISYNKLLKALKESEGFTISQSYLSKIINFPDNNSMPLPYLLQCCDFFGITLDAIVSSKFSIENYCVGEKSNFKKLLDTKEIIRNFEEKRNAAEEASLESASYGEIENNCTINSAFVENPNNILFSSFLQTYYCYFYPTVSSENKELDSLLTGNLTIEPDGDICKAILRIDTKKKKNGSKAYKVYEGTAMISSTVNNMYCMLRSEEIGEYCYLIFRHSHLNFALQDCHMAEVLSTSSAGGKKKRYPTALRMFLSREKISDEHLKFLAPHLWLNYSQITISEEGLKKVRRISDDYSEIVKDLLEKADSEHMYLFQERDALNLAKNHMDKAASIKFISDLRRCSYAYRYNKVSDTVEDTVRELLISLGYYKDDDKME